MTTVSPVTRTNVFSFLKESLAIEGIHRNPTSDEIDITVEFLSLPEITVQDVCNLQAIYEPDMPIRDQVGMNVRVGGHFPKKGGPEIRNLLATIVRWANENVANPWDVHCDFEELHPFMDGNGRTGRILLAWHMRRAGKDPFSLSFLHRWYYQTLENCANG